MNENLHSDDEILDRVRRRLADAEPLIPQPPALGPAFTEAAQARPRVAVRSRAGVGGFAALAVVAALVVVTAGFLVGGRPSNGNGSAGSSGTASISIQYQLVHPAGTEVTSAQLDATKTVLEKRLASLGATSIQVKGIGEGNALITDQVWINVEGVADTAKVRRIAGQAGRVEFVLLPPETYGTVETPGQKAIPSARDSIDPSLPAQFTGADLDPSATTASNDTASDGGGWVVDFAFKDPAGGQLETWSGQHVNDYFAIVLDGKVLSAPYIKSPIVGGKGQIAGAFTAESAQELAAVLQAGWLPFDLREETVAIDPGNGMMKINSPLSTVPPGIAGSGRTVGDPNAPVTLDVWIDYQCSACAAFDQGVLPQVLGKYVAPGKVRVVYHDFLVIDSQTAGHESLDAANAARCAADADQFANYNAWLFGNAGQEGSGAFGKARLIEIGTAAGLDTTQFRACVENGAHDAEVQAESASAPASATGVPAVFVGHSLVSSYSIEALSAAIDAALTGRPLPTALVPTAAAVLSAAPTESGGAIHSAAPIESGVPLQSGVPSAIGSPPAAPSPQL
ncbi:MAG: thioredoxin domain-containing protein [Candidatus Limnocylindrales bacterium]